MNTGLAVGAYPPLARPIVPLLRLVRPIVYGRGALLRATRSSVHLASSPEVAAINRTYFSSRAVPAPWPDAVLDDRTRAAVWEFCTEHRRHSTPR